MRSNSRHDRRRSPSPKHHKSRPRSNSPSPPRPSTTDLQAIRITINNVPSRPKRFTVFSDREEFEGLENPLPRSKDQKKIQIEIRRSIPKHRESQSPVRRSIRDHTTVFIIRKKSKSLKIVDHVVHDFEELKLKRSNHSRLKMV